MLSALSHVRLLSDPFMHDLPICFRVGGIRIKSRTNHGESMDKKSIHTIAKSTIKTETNSELSCSVEMCDMIFQPNTHSEGVPC